MKCGRCGDEIMLGAAYCGRCGWSVLGAESTPLLDDLGGEPPDLDGGTIAAPPPPPPPPSRPAPPPPPPRPSPAPGFAAPPPPPAGYTAGAGTPAAKAVPPQPRSSGAGCVSFVVLVAVALLGVGIFFAVGRASDVTDVVDDVRDSFETGSSSFDNDREPAPAVGPGVGEGDVHELDRLRVAVHPLEGTGTVTISAFGVDNFDPVIRVVGPDGEVLGEDDDGGSGTDAQLTVELDGRPGTLLLVRNFGARDGAYSLLVAEGGVAGGPAGVGAPLTVGPPAGGIIAEPGDTVRHPFTGSGAEVVITVQGVTTLDPVVTVLDATGAQLARNDDFEPSASRDARVQLTIAAGQAVSVEVSGFGVSTGPYLVTVEAAG